MTRRTRIFLLVISVLAQVHSASEDESSTAPVTVTRRPFQNIYTILQQNEIKNVTCHIGNGTYLVKENQCISDDHLFSECLFVITPVGEVNTPRLYLNIEMAGTSTIGQTLNIDTQIANAVIAFRSTATLINSSICQISSLEVYRGSEQAIEISHKGFILSSDGSLEIHIDQLIYSSIEYLGELYRMNFSCLGIRLLESGCLFFKVFGMTDIREAKFNGSIPGTLPTPPLLTILVEPNNNILSAITPLSVVGVLFLSISIMIICVILKFWNRRNGQLHVQTISGEAIQSQNQDATVTLQPNTGQRNPAYIQLGPVDGSQADLVTGSCSENPAYNIDARTSSYQEPSYEVIPLDIDRTPHPVQGTQNITYNQNPAYGLHSNPN